MTLRQKIEKDLENSLKAKDQVRISILRYLISAIQNAQIAKGKDSPLTDSEVVLEIAKEVKRHQESIEAFEKAERIDLANKEKKELEILQSFLPAMLTEAEIGKIVDETISATGAASAADFGKVMASVMPKVAGQAQGSVVARVVRSKLGG